MFTNTIKHRIIFTFIFITCFLLIGFLLFYPIYQSNQIFIPYIETSFNICERFPLLWEYIKLAYIISYIFVSFLYSNLFYKLFSKKKFPTPLASYHKSTYPDICLYVGNTKDNFPIYLPKESLYQNILITGTIGTGKTSSAMYPFTKQLIRYQCQTSDLKLGMLILDVKGNYHEKVLEYAKQYGRLNDIIVIELHRKD